MARAVLIGLGLLAFGGAQAGAELPETCAAAQGSCGDDVNLLQRRVHGSLAATARQDPVNATAPEDGDDWGTAPCAVGAEMVCPGSMGGPHCSGNQCCPGSSSLGSFVCPSASPGWDECDQAKRYNCVGHPGVGPARPPAKPYHPHFDTSPDYLHIAARARGVSGHGGEVSDNYYLVVGDWGGCGFGCCCQMQEEVAEKMLQYVVARKKRNPKSTLLFVLSVGDNFYWNGVNEQSFNRSWASVYAPELREVPWFSVMGNHDYGNDDPGSGCPGKTPRFTCHRRNRHSAACGGRRPYSTRKQGYDSNQLNANKGGLGGRQRANYHMPDYTYYYTIPELRFELVAMDWNWLAGFPGVIGGNGIAPGAGAAKLAEHCGSDVALSRAMRGVQDASTKILRERAHAANQDNVAIIGHYPAIFQGGASFRDMYLQGAPHYRKGKLKVFNFYGHTHVQQCDKTDGASCVEFLTGGSGGCCSTSDVPAGFVAISWDSSFSQVIECFLDKDCTIRKYDSNSDESLDSICEHTLDHPACPRPSTP